MGQRFLCGYSSPWPSLGIRGFPAARPTTCSRRGRCCSWLAPLSLRFGSDILNLHSSALVIFCSFAIGIRGILINISMLAAEIAHSRRGLGLGCLSNGGTSCKQWDVLLVFIHNGGFCNVS